VALPAVVSRTLPLSVLAALLVSAPLFAAAQPQPKEAAQPPKPEPAAPLKIEEEVRFVLDDKGRRDPFTFMAKVRVAPPPRDGQPPPPGPVEGIVKTKQASEKAYADAEKAFLGIARGVNPLDVITHCDEGLVKLREVADIAKWHDLIELRERLFDLRRAADRLRVREEVTGNFEKLGIRLTGVVVRGRHSLALVNGKPVGIGEVVRIDDSNEILVDDIRSDQVIFVYQGFKMAKKLTEASGSGAASGPGTPRPKAR
jgi:hypothetical protein